jgi:UDP-N-acetylmuramoyl-L-alanyl-D-glutamate--2,6-diaminopimelate ligase
MHTLLDLLGPLRSYQLHGTADPATVAIASVTFDSRTVTAGGLFAALTGHRVDGHRFIPNALERGAAAVVGERTLAELAAQDITLPPHLPYVQVADSRLALAHCCAALHDYPSRALTVVGITGTDGKTTTTSLLEAILSAASRDDTQANGRVGAITTVGARIRGVERDTGLHVTTPDAPAVQRFLAEMREAGCRYAVVESTSHGLAQHRVAGVDFDIAAVTNITHEHLDEHGTRQAYVAAKAKLFRSLYLSPVKAGIPRGAVINADDVGSFAALCAVLAEEAQQQGVEIAVRSYGIAGQTVDPTHTPDVLAHQVCYQPNRTHFEVQWWGGHFAVESQLIGDFNVSNVLCAMTSALLLKTPISAIQAGVAAFRGVIGRMERIDRGQPFLAVVDFAHTPVSLQRALTTLRTLVGVRPDGAPGQLIAVFGSAGLRDREKRYLMGRISGRLADFSVITAEDPRTEALSDINAAIAAGALDGTQDAHKFTIVPDRAEAIQFAVQMAQPGDVVAAFGKGHERSMCYGEIEYPWNDQAAMARALEKRR